jgi:electron transfer flavoprotein alpha subunit
MDCVALSIEGGRLQQTKPVYGGNAQAVYVTDTDPQIATVRAKVMEPLAPDAGRQGEVINVDAGLDASAIKTKVLDKVKEEVQGVKLEDAVVVIAGGRGIGGADGFKQLQELADLFKGAVGASRPACDNEWIPDTQQVGLTGKIVTPDLYIAIGISGASQHLAGCSSSKMMVAINKDPEANIFREADYGVVGDWKKVFPAFVEKVKALLAG